MGKLEFFNDTMVDYNQLRHLVGNDILRPVLQHVYLDIEKSRIVGTDAHKLFWYPITITSNTFSPDVKGIMMNPKIFHIASYTEKIPNNLRGVLVYVAEEKTSKVLFLERKVYEADNLTEGVYPDYERVIPKEIGNARELKISKSVLSSLSKILPPTFNSIMFESATSLSTATKVKVKGSIGVMIEGIFMPIQEEF